MGSGADTLPHQDKPEFESHKCNTNFFFVGKIASWSS